MSNERRVQSNVYIEPVHTNGMVIYGYSGSNNHGQQYSPRPYQNNTNYPRYYSTPPPSLPNDIPIRYKTYNSRIFCQILYTTCNETISLKNIFPQLKKSY